ncbi:GTP cyclohydrolase 1-like, partial [Arctopsyche grandis]|uniref:GTP cyclohydrolase 1-like n=1 Tax=Arctopsyche grandis TaxID=121162 RepID=UPI00406D6C03
MVVNQEKIAEAIKMIIEAIDEDPNREGLVETPKRVAKMYAELFSGIEQDAKVHLSKTFKVGSNDLIVEKDISFYSMCEHHFLPFFGKVHIGYIPNGNVVGLSKLARTVEMYSKRPQIQEKMTSEIAEAIMTCLKPKGTMIIIEAQHMYNEMSKILKEVKERDFESVLEFIENRKKSEGQWKNDDKEKMLEEMRKRNDIQKMEDER